jgi:hypothetical protein
LNYNNRIVTKLSQLYNCNKMSQLYNCNLQPVLFEKYCEFCSFLLPYFRIVPSDTIYFHTFLNY